MTLHELQKRLVAHGCKITVQSLSAIELGIVTPKLYTAQSIAKVLPIDLHKWDGKAMRDMRKAR